MDYTDKIIDILELLKADVERGDHPAKKFKIRAYDNAIRIISNLDFKIITTEDVEKVEGIGQKIRDKMYEIVLTGELEEARGLAELKEIRSKLLNIFDVGPVKAEELINKYNIESIEQLRKMVNKDPTILTKAQKMGLDFYEDLTLRIPRDEIMEHDFFLREFFLEIAPEFSMTIVGSYRRGVETSGDIDILLTYHGISYEEAVEKFKKCINELVKTEYIVGILKQGGSKFLAISQLMKGLPARRLDILLTKPEQMACALLYFTGSQAFNINFRKIALIKGYTLNEYEMKKLELKGVSLPIPDVPPFRTERDVFKFLDIEFVHPFDRK